MTPTIFIWKVDGDPHTGPLCSYARMWEESRYSDAFTLSNTVLTWYDRDPITWVVKITELPGLGDWLLYEITVPGLPDKATARLNALA